MIQYPGYDWYRLPELCDRGHRGDARDLWDTVTLIMRANPIEESTVAKKKEKENGKKKVCLFVKSGRGRKRPVGRRKKMR